jgi:hypothetical protein
MTVDTAGLAVSAWSYTARGSCSHPESAAAAADIERTLFGHLANVMADSRYGVTESQFAGQTIAGTPGIPEPEPEPALPALSLEAQNTALTEQLNEARAALANIPALVAAELAKQAAGSGA